MTRHLAQRTRRGRSETRPPPEERSERVRAKWGLHLAAVARPTAPTVVVSSCRAPKGLWLDQLYGTQMETPLERNPSVAAHLWTCDIKHIPDSGAPNQ